MPIIRGLALGRDDLVRRAIIMEMMCQGGIQYKPVELGFLIDFQRYFASELEALRTLAQHGLVVFTDSGGMQEETTALGVPCLTLRENTERPITVEEGTNTVVGTDPARIERTAAEVLAGGGKAGRTPELWDGRAAVRIAEILRRDLMPAGSRSAAMGG